MKMYFWISLVTIAIFAPLNSFVIMPEISIWSSIGMFLVAGLALFAINGLTSGLSHRYLRKLADPEKKFYQVSAKEKQRYEKIGVRKFKDRLPDGGVFVGFRKARIEDTNNLEYVKEYLKESCYGELGHWLSIFTGFLLMLFFPVKLMLGVTFPLTLLNVVLNVMPIMSLRYNRYKLNVLKERLLRNQKFNKIQDDEQKVA